MAIELSFCCQIFQECFCSLLASFNNKRCASFTVVIGICKFACIVIRYLKFIDIDEIHFILDIIYKLFCLFNLVRYSRNLYAYIPLIRYCNFNPFPFFRIIKIRVKPDFIKPSFIKIFYPFLCNKSQWRI